MATPQAAATAPGFRRIAINLSDQAYFDLKQTADENSRNMTDVIRLGIGLFKVAAEAMRAKNKLVVVSQDGKPLKEIVLPSF